MGGLIHVRDESEITAPASLADQRTRVLKHGETFAVFNRYGDIQPDHGGEQGLYHEGTRFLSRLCLLLAGKPPVLLSSTVRDDNGLLAVDLTNAEFHCNGTLIPRGTLHLFRAKFLWQGACYERMRLWNFSGHRLELPLTIFLGADFHDIFEVRGTPRRQRGVDLPERTEPDGAVLRYRGLDEVTRSTEIHWAPDAEYTDGRVEFFVVLEPLAESTLHMTVRCTGESSLPSQPYDEAFSEATSFSDRAQERYCHIETSNAQFNDFLKRSAADLQMMVTETSAGPYPYAGVPWFNTVFGRDGIITAYEALWINPDLARGVLRYLAANQARENQAARDAEPGKILHETRLGEMAALGEVPFARYYGSVDSTPLFVMLAAAYYERTGDAATIEAIWPNIEMALEWMTRHGDVDGDGFLEYARHSDRGLLQQGWKDSFDSVFHADGSAARGPIALCEVQGYAYGAWMGAADLALALGKREQAAQWQARARDLQSRFQQQFWCAEISMYALALDGDKRQCCVRTSNAGQCLFSGIASAEHAQAIGKALFEPDFFSGWGIRTLASRQPRFNPMSYHNGSVWPHDNALIAYGLAKYGYRNLAAKLLSATFDASMFVELRRLPELFCGFARHPGLGPTLYPVACSPQSWAAASVFLMLQACLGLRIDGRRQEVHFHHAMLPKFLREVRIRNLNVGDASLNLSLFRHPHDVGMRIDRREGDVTIHGVR